MSDDKLYAHRNAMEQGEHYTKHVMAMTAEDLHRKSDIAAELAHRDIEISRLREELSLSKEQTEYALEAMVAMKERAEQAERQLAGVVEALQDTIQMLEITMSVTGHVDAMCDEAIKCGKQALANLPESAKRIMDVQAKYNELIYHVSKVHPNESRHETALRYIKQAEAQDNAPASALKEQER